MKRGNNPYDSLVSFISRCNISTREEVRLREIISDIKKFDESTPVTGESEAIAAIEFLLDVNANGLKGDRFHKIEMCDGDFYWETDKDGDQPMDGKDIYNLYKQSKK